MLHRRLEPSADIAPLKVAELDEARSYCRNQVEQLVADQPRLDDQGLKEAILNHADCPELIKRLSLERPSVFDLLCSKNRFRPELFDMQRQLLLQKETGRISEQDMFNRMFHQMVPNSATILRDLQKAAEKAQTSANIQ